MSVICTAVIGRDLDIDSWTIGPFTFRLAVQDDVDNSRASAVGSMIVTHTAGETVLGRDEYEEP